jgi:creatinine amidohydrolase/Fe(II)-dependent formamide hydrolase-like protein
VRVHYVSDLYYKSLEQSKAYLTVRGIPPGTHAGPGDTSELWFIDSTGSWIRRDKLAPGSRATESATGVAGDPTRASAELGRVLVGYKISNAVAQIRRLQSSAH